MTPRSPSKGSLGFIFATSLALQGVFLYESRVDPTFHTPIIDSAVYHDMAVRFAREGVLSDEAFWQPPLFPFILGCLYRLVGVNIVTAKFLLAVLNALSCTLTASIAARAYSPRVGVTAGLMLAAWGPFVVMGAQFLPVSLALFLNLLAIRLWTTYASRPSWKLGLGIGAIVGLATLTVPNSIVLGIPMVVLDLAGRFRAAPLRSTLEIGSFLGGLALTLAPVAARNYFVGGEWATISTNSGINLYIGNNPDSERTLALRPGLEWKRLARRSFDNGDYLSPAKQDAWFRRQVRDYVRRQPLDFLAGLAKKTLHFVNAREIPRNLDAYTFRDHSALLSVLLWRVGSFAFPWGLAAPLAVMGILTSCHGVRSSSCRESSSENQSPSFVPGATAECGVTGVTALRRMLLFCLVLYAATVILFFVSGRYRLPMVPIVVIFAAAGGWWLADQLRASRRSGTSVSSRLAIIAAGLAAAVLVNLPISTAVDHVNFRAEMHMCVGATLTEQGRLPEAFEHLEKALRLQPDYVEGHNKLAWVNTLQGEFADAEHRLRESLRLSADNPEAWRILAEVLRKTGRADEAVQAFRRAIDLDPTGPDAYAGLASLLMKRGEDEAAQPILDRAVRLNPTSGPYHLHYAELLLRLNRFAEAVHHFKQALPRTTPDPATLNTIAWTLATCPDRAARDCALAIELGERLVAVTEGRNPIAHDTLAAAYAECGRYVDAVRSIRRAVELARSSGDEALLESLRPRLEWYESKMSSPGGS